MFTSKARTDDSRLLHLQESNLTARQPLRATHHVIQATTSEELAQGPYVAARDGVEPVTEGTEQHHSATTPLSIAVHRDFTTKQTMQRIVKLMISWWCVNGCVEPDHRMAIK